ncbi:hypothetical protein RJ640_029305 [Escallonia rubra]|uniref:DUF6821 domain-containing protein n=1 Tax=Escallonia rubra TaxID=112253 RepID=A0AA88QZ57_9ASTE|nr:hypothetical protein RJ640_029305 [Escallonia rubra]
MDLEEWEFLPDDGFLEVHDDGGKKIFSRKYGTVSKNVFKMNYFEVLPPKSPKFVDSSEEPRLPKQQLLVPVPIKFDPAPADHEVVKELTIVPVEVPMKSPTFGAVEANQDSVSQVFFKKMKENEFVDMKMDSPRSGNRGGIMTQMETGTLQFEEKSEGSYKVDQAMEKEILGSDIKEENVTWEESNGGLKLNIWKMSLSGLGAICSFGVAAATVCIIVLGSGHTNKHHQLNHQNFRIQLSGDEKRMKQVFPHATTLNEAISAVRGVPLARAHITYGGYYDGI